MLTAMSPELKAKLQTLPGEPGVYFHKNSAGRLYI
jgi:excinuclease UvrABC nuclease subunit